MNEFSRRGLLAGAAAIGVTGALAACGDDSTSAPPASTGGNGSTTVSAAKVPVGSAAIVGEVVVSQPTAGSFKAFSAVCPHQGCLVSRVEGKEITCVCHGSAFSAADGSVLSGPSPRGLIARTVTVNGDNLTVA
jgi:nitrite reductase/ring-hydroxylating ferredoxin subunit